MKALYVAHYFDGEPKDVGPFPIGSTCVAYEYSGEAAAEVEDEGSRIVKYVELTPRVRLGLWLAEDETRRWRPGKVGDTWTIEIESPSFYRCGTGPTLDAAIEDALAKLPAKGER